VNAAVTEPPDLGGDDVRALIAQLAVEHGVALDPSDPILIVQTATTKIVQRLLQRAEAHYDQTLASHREKLELSASKWHADSERTAGKLVEGLRGTVAEHVGREVDTAAQAAATRLVQVRSRHEKSLARASLACALSAAVALLAAGAVVLLVARGPVCAPSPTPLAPAQAR